MIKKEKPKVKVTWKLCDEMMTCLFCLSYSVTKDIEDSNDYARNKFEQIMEEWERLNGFEFDIVDYNEED